MSIEIPLGIGVLVSVIVGLVKKTGKLTDGYAGLVALVLNVLAFAGVSWAVFTCAPEAGEFGLTCIDLTKAESFASKMAELLALLSGLIPMIGGSWLTHKLARLMWPKNTSPLPPFK